MKHTIPDAAIDKHVVIFGMTGSGKTSTIKSVIVEPDLEADRRVIIITPKDDWWGLRLSKSGKSQAYDIPIFGGWHADYPLNVKDAALLADTYGTMKGSAIFCTSRMSGQERATWFAAFAERLLANNKGWVRVVIDEAHVFMPKQGGKGGGSIPMALHAGNELVSQGRSVGLRIVLASQRSAKLHNDASTQCSCLMAMLLMGPHDRDAVKDWIEDQADPVKGKEIIASLSTLKPGEAWVWAPSAKLLDRVHFLRPQTFDSSAAPADDAGDAPVLKPINLDKLKGALATVEAERKANDPAALKAEVARLTRELGAKPALPTVADAKVIRKEGFDAGAAHGAGVERARLTKLMKPVADNLDKIFYASESSREAFSKLWAEPISAPSTSGAASSLASALDGRLAQIERAPPIPRSSPRPPAEGSSKLPKAERMLLTALAQYPDGRTKNQAAILTGYAPNGGGFNNAISSARSAGRLQGAGDLLKITDQGIADLGDFEPLPHGDALLQHWMRQLGKAEKAALAAIVLSFPNAISKEDAAFQAGYEPSGGGFNNALSRLRSLELINGRGDLRASEALFG